MANDITGPMALPIFRQMADKVFDKDKVVLVPDHFTPNKDIKSAENSKAIREFAKDQGLSWYFEQGKSGVEHAILPEAGVVAAGSIGAGGYVIYGYESLPKEVEEAQVIEDPGPEPEEEVAEEEPVEEEELEEEEEEEDY